MNNEESSLKIVCFILGFAVIFCLCAWLYYHGFYEGYYHAYSDYKQGNIDNPDNERFQHRYNINK